MMFETEKLKVKIELINKLLEYHAEKELNINNAVDLLVNLRSKYETQLEEVKKVHESIENS